VDIEQLVATAPPTAGRRLRDRMSPCSPYTYTHGNVDITNIMVNGPEGNVTGILGCEWSGYFPVWWAYARDTTWGHSEDDAQ
jgi:hypothetical protein